MTEDAARVAAQLDYEPARPPAKTYWRYVMFIGAWLAAALCLPVPAWAVAVPSILFGMALALSLRNVRA